MTSKLYLGDCLEVLDELKENSIDTCITDPPYHLTSITKRFGKKGSAPAKYGTDGAFVRSSAGFMGKEWDGGDIAFRPSTWEKVYRVLKPGALLLAFGGTRTYHRLVCAIEDAGFEIRDTVGWVYGSGFPKALDISKAIDKRAGAEREIVGYKETSTYPDSDGVAHYKNRQQSSGSQVNTGGMPEITVPATPEAQLWNGWKTSLKPAMELIVVAQKPIDGTYAENALKWGVAGFWIDGGRVGTEERANPQAGFIRRGRTDEEVFGGVDKHKPDGELTVTGRFPANLIHDGSDEVVSGFPNDAQRFFYCAKASRSERNAGLEGMEERWIDESRKEGAVGGNNPRNRGARSATNHHPTVKPIALMRYLVRLTKTPTGGVVLDPFMGSGTTGCACALEGRDFIGIEKEPEYFEIAEKRIDYWSNNLDNKPNV